MSYRSEKNQNGDYDIVISGWEKGIAESPYLGISDMRNINNRWYPEMAYINYERQLTSTANDTETFTVTAATTTVTSTLNVKVGDVIQVSSTVTLPSPLVVSTYYQVITVGSGVFTIGLFNNDSTFYDTTPITFTDTGTGVHTATTVTMGQQIQAIEYPQVNDGTQAVIWFILDAFGIVWSNYSTGTHYFSPLVYATGSPSYSLNRGMVFYGAFLFIFLDDGTIYYFDPSNNTVTEWSGNTLISSFPHYALSGYDNIAYICNENNIATIIYVGSPTNIGNYTLNDAALTTLSPTVPITYLAELGVNLVMAVGNKIFTWDRTSTGVNLPLPINEIIQKIVNINNILYITAGIKGNIYISNGYSIQIFTKIPDGITGAIDPTWSWGGIMGYRGKLYVGAACTVPASAGVIGIFSFDLTTKSINIENQSSIGSVVSSMLDNVYLLMNDADFVAYNTNDSIAQTYDFYYSAWWSGVGNGVGGVDDNTRQPYSNGEAYIISDLIPVGTFLQERTFNQIEFKLDSPLLWDSSDAVGESVSLYYRQTLQDSFVLIGSTSATLANQTIFSDLYPVNFEKSQWAQFKIVLKGLPKTTGNSYVRLREIRIH